MSNKIILKNSILKGLLAGLLTLLVYYFFYIEFVRSTVEDMAFDAINWLYLSQTVEDTKSPYVFLLMVDDKYLESKNLVDENGDTTYGYMFPREYLAEIISSVDTFVEDLDEENHPKALFLDYDMTYLTDPLNKSPSSGDLAFLEILKKKRPYNIYLPMTENQNFIYHSKDKQIQQLIKTKKINFVSVGLTIASDQISRRYYSFDTYKDNGKDKVFTNVAIELWRSYNNKNFNIKEEFSQSGKSLIENRIILKEYYNRTDTKEFSSSQSYWTKFSAMSANYPLDMIYEDLFKDSIIMIGATHKFSQDTFETNIFNNEKSGIEVHANALMTLFYLDGKLNRLPLQYSILIIVLVVFLVDILLAKIYKPFVKFRGRLKRDKSKKIVNKLGFLLQHTISFILKPNRDEFQDRWVIWISMIILLIISYEVLVVYKLWFNWMIPALLSSSYVIFMFISKPIQKIVRKF